VSRFLVTQLVCNSKKLDRDRCRLSSTFAVFTGSCSAAQMIQQHDPQRPG